MSTPYVGEIRIFAGNFAPNGWAFCDGATMSVANDEVLYQLIGTTYGGDGVNTFNLPDLRGRVVTHQGVKSGQSYVLGQMAGVETVTLTTAQIPQHWHPLLATTAVGDLGTPGANTMLAAVPAGSRVFPYGPTSMTQTVTSPTSTTVAGGSQSHENMQPYLGVNFIIALYGVFPSQG